MEVFLYPWYTLYPVLLQNPKVIKLQSKMANTVDATEECFDEFEHYNYDQDKAMMSGHSGK